jgi:thioredoxin 2
MADPPHVVCPACDAVNRVPRERLNSGGRCGKCHHPLFTSHPIAMARQRIDRHIERSSIPLLVDFWAEWCAPCKMMAPNFERAAGLLEPKVRLAKVNTEEEQDLARRYGIRSIPTLVLFKDGAEAGRVSGALDLQRLLDWTRQHL